MTIGTEVDRVIVTVDLRDINPATVLGRPFYELQAKQGSTLSGQQVDFGRVVLIDRAADLMAHDEIYAHVLDSHIDVSMVCVALGGPLAEDPTVAIRRPLQLGPPKAAVLWVGDLDGIGWRMDSTLASQVNLPANGTAPDPARLPRDLLDLLSLPQVFDEVIELVSAMPGNVASPGLRTVHGDVPADILTIAQRAAIKQLTREIGGVADMPSLPELADILNPASGQRPARGAADVIRPSGRIDELTQQCKRAGNSATMLVRRVTSLGGLAGTHSGVRGGLKVFADALGELRGVAAWALDEVDTHSGFDPRHRQDLTDIGIDLTEPPVAVIEQATTTLTEQALASVEKAQPLPAIAGRLRDVADTMAPRGTAKYQPRLQRIVSDSFLKDLRTPPAFISGVPPTPVLVTAFVTCLISGAWAGPVGLYGGLAAIGAILIGGWLLSRGAEISPGPGSAAGKFLGSYSAAAVIGAGCGVGLSRVISLPVPAGLGAVVTVALLVILSLVAWRVLAQHWARTTQTSKVATAPDQVRQLLAEVAREEWQLAGARTRISNHARAVAESIGIAAVALRDQEAKLAGPGAAGGGTQRRSAQDQASQDLVVIDLAAGIANALDRLVSGPGSAGLGTVDSQLVHDEVSAVLDAYRVHLLTASLHEPPLFTRALERRAALVQSLAERGSGLQNAVRFSVTDERITQLCTPHQLTLLETQPDKAELIRFAPRSAQGLIDQRTTGRERPVSWVWASAIAGVLRLVPLRPGAAQDVISKTASRPPSPPGPPTTPPSPAGGS